MSENQSSEPERRKQFLMSMSGTRAEIMEMLKRVAIHVQMGDVDYSWKSQDRGEGSMMVLDTARPPISMRAVVGAELAGVLAEYGDRDPWEEAMRGEGDEVGF